MQYRKHGRLGKNQERYRIGRVGAEGSEPVAEMQSTPVETKVSRKDGNIPALWSLSQETHATKPQGL